MSEPKPDPATPPQPARRPSGREEMEILIRARYPIIYVVSWEEARVEEHLREIAGKRGKKLYTWSVTTGLGKSGSPVGGARKGLADPIDALDAVIEHKEPAIYLFKDFHPFFRARDCNAGVIRKVREVAAALSDSYKTLVVCSPILEVAPELEKAVSVLDYPLPDAADFDRLIGKICEDVSQNTKLKISLPEAEREKLIQAAQGLTLQEAENVFAKTIVNTGRLSPEDAAVVFSEKQQIIRKSGLLEYVEAATGLGDIGGLDQLKDWLRRRALAFSDRARQFGLPAPKGVLLIGVQGCGKSLCAKAVSRMWGLPLLRFDMGRMFASLVGSSEENIRRAIGVAESIAPVVLWVDEIDKAFAGSQGSANTDGGTTARVMSTFLTWLSEKQKAVFVIATANNISQLPPELLRKGRLDEIFFVDLPSAAERDEIFRIHIAKRGRDAERFDRGTLVAATEGFSGAEIEEAVVSGLYDAFYMGKDLESDDVLTAIRATVPLSRTMAEGISALRSWAEGRARLASRRDEEDGLRARRKLEIEGGTS